MRLVVAVLALTALTALAGRAAAGSDPAAAALAHLDRGVDAFHAGDYAAARREFEAAQRLVPGGANAYRWLGLTEVQLGACARAVLDFDRFLSLVPASDERVPEVIRARAQCLEPATPRAPAVVAAPAPVVVAAPAPARTPLARRWWLWTTVSVVVAAGVGLTLGLVLGSPHESQLPAVRCASAGGCTGAP